MEKENKKKISELPKQEEISELPETEKPKLSRVLRDFFGLLIFYFLSSNTIRNEFAVGLLGVIGMVCTSALTGPFGLFVFFGVVALMGAMLTVVSGAWAYRKYIAHLEDPLANLYSKLVGWMHNHKPGTLVGIALFLTTVALIITAVAFPASLVGGPLALAIQFIGSGFAGMGLTLSAPVTAFLAVALLGITAMTLWDIACRIGNLIHPLLPQQKLGEMHIYTREDGEEGYSPIMDPKSKSSQLVSGLSAAISWAFAPRLEENTPKNEQRPHKDHTVSQQNT